MEIIRLVKKLLLVSNKWLTLVERLLQKIEKMVEGQTLHGIVGAYGRSPLQRNYAINYDIQSGEELQEAHSIFI